MLRNTELKTPWHTSGLLHSPGKSKRVLGEAVWPDVGVEEWRDNPVFDMTIRMLGTERGRSAAYFRWQVVGGDLQTGLLLPMFMTDVGHILMQGLAEPGGIVTARFFVVKRGQNYGITIETPDEGHGRPTEDLELPEGTTPSPAAF